MRPFNAWIVAFVPAVAPCVDAASRFLADHEDAQDSKHELSDVLVRQRRLHDDPHRQYRHGNGDEVVEARPVRAVVEEVVADVEPVAPIHLPHGQHDRDVDARCPQGRVRPRGPVHGKNTRLPDLG